MEEKRVHPVLVLCPTFRTLVSYDPWPPPSKPRPNSDIEADGFEFCRHVAATNVGYPVFNRDLLLFQGGEEELKLVAPLEEVGEYCVWAAGGPRKSASAGANERQQRRKDLLAGHTKERAVEVYAIIAHRGPCVKGGSGLHRHGYVAYRKVLRGLFGGRKGYGRFTSF